jgi:fructokinase
LGGGVMNQEHLLARIRKQFAIHLNGYVSVPDLEEYIVSWKLPNRSGIMGCLLLASRGFVKLV